MIGGNCLIGQSGGPTCVINSSLYGIIKEAKKHNEIHKVYGALNGIDGVINDKLVDLSMTDEHNLELLKQTPGAILGSVRYCLKADFNHKDYENILLTLKKHNIRYFFYIGGNDSMDTVHKLSKFLKDANYECYVLGIPKTIDNDLLFTDHTPGYGSAIKFIANSINEIKQDISCYRTGKVTIVEIMGRDTGWLTAGSKLATLNGNAPDLIYLPEMPFDMKDFLKKIKKIYDVKKKVLVCVSEEIKDGNGNYLLKTIDNSANDMFGHIQFGGVASTLADLVKKELDIPVRGIELNLLQRCSSNLVSYVDIKEAIACGSYALKKAIEGNTGKMVVLNRVKSDKYSIKYSLCDISKIANKTKYFPKEWIIDNCDISNEFIKYALPLIKKEYKCKYENGMLKFADLNIKEKV